MSIRRTIAAGFLAAAPASAAQSECNSGFMRNGNDGATSVYDNGSTSRVGMREDVSYGGSNVALVIKVGNRDFLNNADTISSDWNDRFSSGKFN